MVIKVFTGTKYLTKYCEGGYRVGYRKKNETNFCRKKLGIIKVFNTGYYFNQGRRVDSI